MTIHKSIKQKQHRTTKTTQKHENNRRITKHRDRNLRKHTHKTYYNQAIIVNITLKTEPHNKNTFKKLAKMQTRTQ